MNLPNRKPLAPESPEVDPDLCRAFGIPNEEEEEPWGPVVKKTVVEVYLKPFTEPVKTPFEQ
jgi:hypothetical protein